MPAYNFKKQFAREVQSRKKRQTFRVDRKDGYVPKVGDIAYLYTGMRTKYCVKLGQDEITDVQKTVIDIPIRQIQIEGTWLTREEIYKYARADGFNIAMQLFWFFGLTHGNKSISGYTIKW